MVPWSGSFPLATSSNTTWQKWRWKPRRCATTSRTAEGCRRPASGVLRGAGSRRVGCRPMRATQRDLTLDVFELALRRQHATLDQGVRLVEIEKAELRQPWRNHHVGRIPGKPRAGDAVLHDVEGLHHHA